MGVQQVEREGIAQNRLSLLLGGAAFLAALIPMHMTYLMLGLDMTGTAGAIVGRIPWAACLLGSLCLHRGGAARPWWALLSMPIAFPKILALTIAYVAWSIGGFAP